MKRNGFLAIALAAAVTIGCNSNDRKDVNASNPSGSGSAPVGTAGTNTKVSNGDKDFVHDVAIANTAEIELGKIAAERGTNSEVKKFGQMMVDEHTKAGDSFKALASEHNIAVPTDLDDKHRDLRDKLAKLQGADFDREYMDAMVNGHEDVLDRVGSRVDKAKLDERKAQITDSASGKKIKERIEAVSVIPEKSDNPVTMSINEWAASTYPVVEAHLEAAKTIKDALKKRMTN